ncbi:hypothetical protein ADUPG1_002089, partial [Aduncisulcus paluster]
IKRVVSTSIVEIEHLNRDYREKLPASRVKKVKGDMTLYEAKKLAARDDEEFLVEEILKYQTDEEGDPKFLVKWFGWPTEDSSWEYPDTLKDLEAFKVFL